MTIADWLSLSSASEANGDYARKQRVALSGHGFIVFISERFIPVNKASAEKLKKRDSEDGLGWSFGPVDAFSFHFADGLRGMVRFGVHSGHDTSRFNPVARDWRSIEIPIWLLILVVSVPIQMRLIARYRDRHRRRLL